MSTSINTLMNLIIQRASMEILDYNYHLHHIQEVSSVYKYAKIALLSFALMRSIWYMGNTLKRPHRFSSMG